MADRRTQVRVGNRTLSISNLDKVLWPRDGYTKRDLIAYYHAVAPFALPYLRDRPLTLERFPNGIGASSFFEKNAPQGMPAWIRSVTLDSSGGRHERIRYVLCNDAPALVYLANLAAIVLHIWTSRVRSLDEPDFILFDLDPGETCTLATLARVTLALRDALTEIGFVPLVKTSGGMGLHVVVPLHPGHTYDQAKVFAELVARRIAGICGDDVTLQRTIAKRRQAAVYMDYVQVGRGKTLVAPYSVRARDRAPVSWPLLWSEVEAFRRARTPVPADAFAKYTIRTAPKALEREGDRWSGRSWKRAKLATVVERVRTLWR
ncbi:MAG: non-homologous end-joining DNA ligase [Candidatus Tyrphobacter sp.]